MDIDEILNQLDSFFSGKSSKPDVVMTSGDAVFQAPIKGSYACSGAFGIGDERHHGKHNGVDLRAPGGTAVYAIGDGKVELVESWDKGGNIATVLHPNGVRAYYAHLGTVSVKPGQTVNKDTVIGTIGDSGNAKGTYPHLHIEIKVNGSVVNPGKFFYVPKYTSVSKDEVAWLSESEKEKASKFNMNEHKNLLASISSKMITKYF